MPPSGSSSLLMVCTADQAWVGVLHAANEHCSAEARNDTWPKLSSKGKLRRHIRDPALGSTSEVARLGIAFCKSRVKLHTAWAAEFLYPSSFVRESSSRPPELVRLTTGMSLSQ